MQLTQKSTLQPVKSSISLINMKPTMLKRNIKINAKKKNLDKLHSRVIFKMKKKNEKMFNISSQKKKEK